MRDFFDRGNPTAVRIFTAALLSEGRCFYGMREDISMDDIERLPSAREEVDFRGKIRVDGGFVWAKQETSHLARRADSLIALGKGGEANRLYREAVEIMYPGGIRGTMVKMPTPRHDPPPLIVATIVMFHRLTALAKDSHYECPSEFGDYTMIASAAYWAIQVTGGPAGIAAYFVDLDDGWTALDAATSFTVQVLISLASAARKNAHPYQYDALEVITKAEAIVSNCPSLSGGPLHAEAILEHGELLFVAGEEHDTVAADKRAFRMVKQWVDADPGSRSGEAVFARAACRVAQNSFYIMNDLLGVVEPAMIGYRAFLEMDRRDQARWLGSSGVLGIPCNAQSAAALGTLLGIKLADPKHAVPSKFFKEASELMLLATHRQRAWLRHEPGNTHKIRAHLVNLNNWLTINCMAKREPDEMAEACREIRERLPNRGDPCGQEGLDTLDGETFAQNMMLNVNHGEAVIESLKNPPPKPPTRQFQEETRCPGCCPDCPSAST